MVENKKVENNCFFLSLAMRAEKMARRMLNFSDNTVESLPNSMMLRLILVFLQISYRPIDGFNLSPESSRFMEGPKDSQFGYSVALWSDESAIKRLVVGAPRGMNFTREDFEGYRLGNIYLCDLEDQCLADDRVPTVSSSDKSEAALTAGNVMKKYGMGFGQTLTSIKKENSPLAACAPRYPRRTDQSLEARGACFILRDNVADPKLILPFPGRISTKKTKENALMGFSASMINKNDPTLVIGGPMAFYGKGLILNKPLKSGLGSINRNENVDGSHDSYSYEGWQVVNGKFDGSETYIAASVVKYDRNKGKVRFYPQNIDHTRFPNNALEEVYGYDVGAMFGYSLAVGDFDGDEADDLLVGSPMAPVKKPLSLPDAGKVFIYYSPLKKNSRRRLGDPQEISGLESWGRFGLSAAGLGDVNQDGFDDVAVAAPYAGLQKDGVVYIFNGSPNGLRNVASQILRPSDFSVTMSGFGFSLDGGLDMDGNNYPDIIIGAVDSDKALFLRSAPVVTLQGDVSFRRSQISVEDKSCTMERAGYDSRKGLCFDLVVGVSYKSPFLKDTLRMEFSMQLKNQTDPPQFVFKETNDYRYRRELDVLSVESGKRRTHIPIFTESSRSVNGQPVTVSVSVNLLPSSEPEPDLNNGLKPVEPILDALATTSFETSVILTCDNKTCFSTPDLAIQAEAQTLIVGSGLVDISVNLEVRDDPADNVKLSVSHPPYLVYQRVEGTGRTPSCSGYKRPGNIQSEELICSFKYLGAGAKINFTIFFSHNVEELLKTLVSIQPSHIPIVIDVKSDNEDTNLANNNEIISMKVASIAKLFTQEESVPEAITVKVKDTLPVEKLPEGSLPSHQPFPVDQLGPKIEHKFLLTNRGPSPVTGAKVKLQLPLYRGDRRVLYLFEKPVTSTGITCDWPEINPWNLQAPVPGYKSASLQSNGTEASEEILSRKRRQPGDIPPTDESHRRSSSGSEILTTRNLMRSTERATEIVATRDTSRRVYRSSSTSEKKVDCQLQKCQVRCELDTLGADEHVSLTISGYLVVASLDQMDYRKLRVTSYMTPEITQAGSVVINPTAMPTTIVILIKPTESGLSAVPFWLLLLSVLGSILLILLIMAALWKAGFFKRKRVPVPQKQENAASKNPAFHREGQDDLLPKEDQDPSYPQL